MIQKVNPQGPPPARPSPDCWGSWGPPTPYGSRKYYSLEVVQHPIRARMCGFGDKDRRPLAPAAVAKMVVRREDNSVVDVDEVDCSFFLVTVDLWSSDGDKEMNLVLHPTSSDRYIPSSAPKAKRRATTSSVPAPSASASVAPAQAAATATPQTPVPATPASAYPQSASMTPYMQPYSPQGYFPAQPPPGPGAEPFTPVVPVAVPVPVSDAQPFTPVQYTPSADVGAPTWGYPPPAWPEPPVDAARAGEEGGPVDYHTWPASERFAPMEPAGEYAAYSQPPPPPPTSAQQQQQQAQQVQSPQAQHSPQQPPAPPQAQQSQQGQAQGQQGPPLDTSIYASASYAQHQQEHAQQVAFHQRAHAHSQSHPHPHSHPHAHAHPHAHPHEPPSAHPGPAPSSVGPSNIGPGASLSAVSVPVPSTTIPPLPRHTYTRTLVGPLSANACRLLDEHRKPGIFFLFQDLSIRTEGTFRLRLRLMNVGAPPAPEPGGFRVHASASPVLAQTFTEPFVVFSAKRFPGVPDTTALSIALGNQGQKLPLRNRNNKQGRKRAHDESGEESE